jgi:Transmembrane domain of unknown function (DUF3566)
VVTSRAADDNLIDDEDTLTSDIMAPPRQSSRKPTSAKSDPATSAPAKTAVPEDAVSDGKAGGGVSPNGTPAAGKEDALGNGAAANGGPAAAASKDNARPAADATIVDRAPALPADTIRSSRQARSKESDADQAAGSKATAQASADDSPALSFGPPPSAQARSAVDDPTIAYPAESAVKSAGDDPRGTAASGAPASASGPASQAGSMAPAGTRPVQAEPPSVSPAAFAWEMADPPPHSSSSPARTFLRSGTTARNPSAPKAGSSPGAGQATAESPAAARGAAKKAPGPQPKRTARQAHLTVARVEPWSVMKFSFVVSLVAFVILFVAVSVLYGVLAGLGVFDSLQRVVSDVTSSQGSTGVNAKAWFSASRVLGYTALLGSLNIVLITAMSTIGSVVYNLTSRLVGGVEVTLKETE